jgi:hypothetical protein
VLHPGVLMGWYNGDPTAKKYVVGLADGILAHGKKSADGTWTFPDEIDWRTDATRGTLPAGSPPMQLFWAAWRWTGDAKYLTPILSSVERAGSGYEVTPGGIRVPVEKVNLKGLVNFNEDPMGVMGKTDAWGKVALGRAKKGGAGDFDRYLAWQTSGDKQYLSDLYGEEMRKAAATMYTQTEGHWWTDRVEIDNRMLQRTRLGGIALARGNIYPGATVSWKFADPDGAVNVAILVPNPSRNRFKVIGYNVAKTVVKAEMTGWNVAPGTWEVRYGPADTRDNLLAGAKTEIVSFEKSKSLPVSFVPGKTTVYEFMLKTPGEAVENRPDLGIGADDVRVAGRTVSVTVHSLGAKDAPASAVELIDAGGRVAAKAVVPALPAPTDLRPHTATVTLAMPAGFKAKGAAVRIVDGAKEITAMNDVVPLP